MDSFDGQPLREKRERAKWGPHAIVEETIRLGSELQKEQHVEEASHAARPRVLWALSKNDLYVNNRGGEICAAGKCVSPNLTALHIARPTPPVSVTCWLNQVDASA